MTIWLFTIGLSTVIAGFFILVLRSDQVEADNEDVEIAFCKEQLAELDRDVARGIVNAEDAEQKHLEIARKILKLDQAVRAQQKKLKPKQKTLTAVLIAVTVIGGSHLIYLQLGSAYYPGLPQSERIERAAQLLANRPSLREYAASVPIKNQPLQVAEEYRDLVDQLRAAVSEHQSDREGLRLLARVEAGLQNFSAASDVQKQLIDQLGEQATADDYVDYADLLILSVDGYVSPEAETALQSALEIDPENGGALYFLGIMFAQNDRPDNAFRIWRKLLMQGPDDAPWIEPIRANIQEVAYYAGINNFKLPEPQSSTASMAIAPALSDDTLESAAELSQQERAAMIEGMVAGLADRLADQGGPPQDWVRLITAYRVLGDEKAVQNTLQKANEIFAKNPGALALFKNAAETAETAP